MCVKWTPQFLKQIVQKRKKMNNKQFFSQFVKKKKKKKKIKSVSVVNPQKNTCI